MSFTDKVVLVTGGSSGIGAATAIAFAKEGARVAIADINANKLPHVAAACNGKALVLHLDISEDSQAVEAVQRTVDEFGRLDVLVNNAGILRVASLLEGNLMETFDTTMKINLRAPFHLSSLAAPHLIKTKGNIINIASIGGICTSIPNYMSYCVSKAGIAHFTKYAARELAPYGVRVNAVSPGPVITNILENTAFTVTWDDFKELSALNRVSEPNDIADLIMFLVSDKAKSITGSNYVIDNGMLIKS